MAGADTTTFDIPGGSLSGALLEFGRQARVSIIFAKSLTSNAETPGVSGRHSIDDALQTLLDGHCLRYLKVREDLIAVKRGCAAVPDPPSAPIRVDETIEAPAGVEELIVSGRHITGSRIRNPRLTGATPIDVISRPEIELTGAQSVSELLRYVPAVAGNSTSTLISNGGDGTATVTLRGLPASNTLVLINGRRTNADGLFGSSVDLNSIPMGLVDRIEILKDGASAVYGSDAIAGVVNIITREELDGFRLSTFAGQSTSGDRTTVNVDIAAGGEVGSGRYTMGAFLFDQGEVLSRNRKLSRNSDDRLRGGIDKRSSATAPARVVLPEGPVILDNGAIGTSIDDFRVATDEDRYEYRDHTTSIVPSERWSLFARYRKPFGERLEAYTEAILTGTHAINELAPTPLFTAFETTPLTVSAANPFNPFGLDIEDVRRRIGELPPRTQINRTRTWRLVAGIEGAVNDLNWDIAYSYNKTRASETRLNLLNTRNTQAALADGCVATCVPLNVFGQSGSITPRMLDYVGVDAGASGRSRLDILSATIDFPLLELPGGPVETVSGIEYRRESLATDPDELIRTGNTIGGANYQGAKGKRRVWAAYAETAIPLTTSESWLRLMQLNVAIRFSEYDDFGSSWTPRVTFRWQPAEFLALRASASRGFRAPSLTQLFTTQKESFASVNDPCALAANAGVLPGCAVQSDPTLVQFLTLTSGNPNLDAERAKTINYGLVLQPARGLTMTVDYYRIRERGVVDASPQFIVNQNARRLAFADDVARDAMGNISWIRATNMNIGKRDVSGWDFNATQVWKLTDSRVQLTANASYIDRFRDQFDPTTPARDQAGTFVDEASSGNGALPSWKANVGVDWSHAGWRAAYTLHYVSPLDERVPIVETMRRIRAWRVHDIQVRYIGKRSWWTDVSFGVNNAFDESPPFAAAAFNDSYDARTYDITGRFFYLHARRSFGG